jgi:hypothetical protein
MMEENSGKLWAALEMALFTKLCVMQSNTWKVYTGEANERLGQSKESPRATT